MILYSLFLDNEEKAIFCEDKTKNENYDLDDLEKAAIEENKIYYVKKSFDKIETYEALLPIYVDDIKMGTLIIFYSLENTNNLLKEVSIITFSLLLIIFIVYGFMTIIIVRRNRKIEKLAYCDPLTGLFNKRYFIDFIEGQLKENIKDKKALLLVYCKNQSLATLIYGHEELDNLLLEKLDRLRKLNIKNDHLFRYSEDIFLNYVENYNDSSKLIRKSDEILKAFDGIMEVKESSKLVDTRVGILEIGEKQKTIDEVIKHTEITINKIKELENNRFWVFNEAMQEDLILNETIEKELRRATYDGYADEFYLEYQPQADFKTNKIVGLEALVRWKSKELGIISPLKFIDIAEKNQLIIPLGQWILITACKFLKDLEDKELKGIKIAINISVIQLLQDDFFENLMGLIENMKIKSENLELEITETELMNNYDRINEKLNILRKQGISISLDDFGTGYSSLSRLKNLNIDVIKIDKSFVDNIVK